MFDATEASGGNVGENSEREVEMMGLFQSERRVRKNQRIKAINQKTREVRQSRRGKGEMQEKHSSREDHGRRETSTAKTTTTEADDDCRVDDRQEKTRRARESVDVRQSGSLTVWGLGGKRVVQSMKITKYGGW